MRVPGRPRIGPRRGHGIPRIGHLVGGPTAPTGHGITIIGGDFDGNRPGDGAGRDAANAGLDGRH